MTEQRIVTGRGGCLCGAVRYTTHGELRRRISACHCHMCRRHHAGIGYYTSVAKDEIEIDGGTALRWFESSPGVGRGFCQNCGSSLFFREDKTRVVDIAPGSFEQMPDLKVAHHIFVASQGDYYRIDDDLPKYPESSPKS